MGHTQEVQHIYMWKRNGRIVVKLVGDTFEELQDLIKNHNVLGIKKRENLREVASKK